MFGFKLVILLGCLSWSQGNQDYCAICPDHTLCQYHGVGPQCQGEGGSGVSGKERAEIVRVHNSLRSKVASGAETRGVGGPQPKAANLMKMVWDGELAKVAQRWADQCNFAHDSCRNDRRFKVGQNIYWAWKYPKHNVNWTEAIVSWYDEVSQYNRNGVDAYRFESHTGHYTQMLWHNTRAIGCGRKDYGPNKIYVCNYGPAGNWVGEPMYEVGEPCSKCPKNTVCESSLCAKRPKGSGEGKRPKVPKAPEGGNDTGDVEGVSPPSKDDQDVYGRENPKDHSAGDKYPVSSYDDQDEGNEITTTNSIDDNRIELDSRIRKEIEKIKNQIENLVRSVMRRRYH